MTAIPSPEQALEAEIRALDDEIKGLQDRRKNALDELLAKRSPYQVGDLIEWEAGRQKWRGKVEAILPLGLEPYKWICRRQLTDGTMSDVRVEVREWHKPRLVERGGGS